MVPSIPSHSEEERTPAMENMKLLVASLLKTFEALGLTLSNPSRKMLAWLTALLLKTSPSACPG